MQENPVYIFTALPCEAKPLIAHFKLKKETSITPFAIYSNGAIRLTVSGLGKSAMAAAVAYTYALFPTDKLAVMLNIGVAGHKDHALGTLFAAEKITDQDSNKSYYPQLVAELPFLTQQITTVSLPQLDYNTEPLYDMEASAFYETAVRFSSSELIQSLKVISDNKNNAIEQITAVKVSGWIQEHLGAIEQCIKNLQALASECKELELNEYVKITQQWRFSHNEALQLKRLLSCWDVLTNGKALNLERQQGLTGKQFLFYLQQSVAELAFGCFNKAIN
jgi:hypothetical protein